jgi:hypothetical protein
VAELTGKSPIRRLLSHIRSQGVAYLALFVALGGTAYAASLPANSVGPAQLQKGAVTTPKIKDEAVTTGKVRDATLQSQDFAAGVLLRGAEGAAGQAGSPGPPGPPGETGKTGGVDTTILWAVVAAGNGVTPASIARGKHAVSANRTSAGYEEVKFDRDVSACAYNATLGGTSSAVSPGVYTPTSIYAISKSGEPETVWVTIAYLSGGFPTGLDADFHLIVAC